MKNYVAAYAIFLNEENIFHDQIKWKYLIFEIRNLSIHFPASEVNKRNQLNDYFRK